MLRLPYRVIAPDPELGGSSQWRSGQAWLQRSPKVHVRAHANGCECVRMGMDGVLGVQGWCQCRANAYIIRYHVIYYMVTCYIHNCESLIVHMWTLWMSCCGCQQTVYRDCFLSLHSEYIFIYNIIYYIILYYIYPIGHMWTTHSCTCEWVWMGVNGCECGVLGVQGWCKFGVNVCIARTYI